jgi:hypothetical protein
MAIYTVTTTSDVVDPADGLLSLREALALVDADPATADTIDFAPNVQGSRIVLGGSQLTVNSDVTIDGGAGVTIDANQTSRVLLVAGGTDTDPNEVTLDSLTISGGKTTANYDGGGGIRASQHTRLTFVDGTVSGNSTTGESASGGGISGYIVTLTNSTVTVNSTAGTYADGGGTYGVDVTLTNSTVTGNSTAGVVADGGGIRGLDVTLTDSTVSGNDTTGDYSRGGGISGDSVMMTDSTVSGNSAAGGAGGISGYYITLTNSTVSGNSTGGEFARGGGIEGSYVTLTDSTVSGNSAAGSAGGIYGGDVTLTNSTVTGNSTAGTYADGGGIYGGDVTLTNSTVTGNSTAGTYADGGGISGGYVTLANSIVAGNTTVGGAGPDVAGYLVSSGLNIFGSAVDGSVPSDRQNVAPRTVFAAVDPVTGGGLLADNGGPTETVALLDEADNPALGRADPEIAPMTDQRGVARPQPAGTAPDIGAFELDQSNPSPPPVGTTFVVTTASDVTADDGQLTLREALALADADSLTKDRIEFDPAVHGKTITLAGSQLTANSDITIDGGTGITIDANQASRVLLVRGLGSDVSLQHLTVTGGRTTADYDGGGGIRAGRHTTLALDNTIVSGSSTAGGGGGISGESVTLTNSTVTGNSAAGGAGGISGYYVTLTNSTVNGNSTAGLVANGGGIFGSVSVTLTNSTVSGNSISASMYAAGGGISGYYVTLTNSTVSGNSMAGDRAYGGGIDGTYVRLTDSTVSGNDTTGYYSRGGGIRAIRVVTLTDSTISGNSTVGDYSDGGGIFGGYVALSNSIVAGNNSSMREDVAGSITSSNGHNIFGSDVDGNAPGDLENVPTSLLFSGGLSDHGGPTQTIALLDSPANPALAGADPADATATDQRGVARPQPAGTAPDIGAFELDQSTGGGEILGTARADTLRGTAAADVIRGRAGDDLLKGLGGDDWLFGDRGDDRLQGNQGLDQLNGGWGCDRFVYRSLADAPVDGPGYDEILDFSRRQQDRIDNSPLDARAGVAGNQAFAFVRQAEFSAPGQLRYEAAADGCFLVEGNVDRNLDADFAILVRTDLAGLRAADFLL